MTEKQTQEQQTQTFASLRTFCARYIRRVLMVSLLAAIFIGCDSTQQEQTNSQAGQNSQSEDPAPATTAESAGVQGNGSATAQAASAAEAFLDTLDSEQRAETTFGYDDTQRSNWTNLPATGEERNGVSFGDLTEEQQQSAMEVLEASLSPEGYEQAVGIMVGDEVLANTISQFGIEQYDVAIFGTPSETDPWLLQFTGHHLALNVAFAGEDSSLTPSFIGVQPSEYTLDEVPDLNFVPAEVLGGGTIRPMAAENDKAFQLMNALDEQQQEQATLDYEISEVVLGAGEDGRQLEPEGLRASEMNLDQRDMLLSLISEWTGVANEEAAAAKMAEVRNNLADTYFAWYGPTENGSVVYYRITGPTLNIEFAHQAQPAPGGVLHLHTIYRDPTSEYGEDISSETVSIP